MLNKTYSLKAGYQPKAGIHNLVCPDDFWQKDCQSASKPSTHQRHLFPIKNCMQLIYNKLNVLQLESIFAETGKTFTLINIYSSETKTARTQADHAIGVAICLTGQ